jgi:type II secretory pathway component GspD/PulD (secretin)
MRRGAVVNLIAAALIVTAPSNAVAQSGAARTIPALGFENADVRAVMGIIAEYGGVNIVTDQQVVGTVTLNLRGVTWIDALLAVMTQLDLVTIPGLDVIAGGLPQGTQFIQVLRRLDFNTRQQQLLQQQRDLATSQPLETYIIRLSHSRAQEIMTAVQPLAGSEGTIQVDTRTNSLLVRDYPENIALIDEVVKQLDIPVRQIRIEAKLLEVNSDQLRELGLQWDLNVGGANPLVITGNTNLGASSSVDLVTTLTSGTLTLDGTISALETQGVANIVATPSISVLDNATGRIFMGEQIPLRQLDVAGNVTIQLQQVGTELIVTPHIVKDDRIILELAPKRESFRVDPSAGIIITTQEAVTNVEVGDGETVVIGGLKSEEVQEADTGIPILMDIPIIGALFRFRRTQVQVRDMILFITPRIERGSSVIRP